MPVMFLLFPLLVPLTAVVGVLGVSALRNRYNRGAERVDWSVWWAGWLAWGLSWAPVVGAVVVAVVAAVGAVVAVATFPKWWPGARRALVALWRVLSWVV